MVTALGKVNWVKLGERTGNTMARHSFDMKDGKRIRDRTGSQFTGDAAAIDHARLIACSIAATTRDDAQTAICVGRA
jgi:uncharacterized protein DUF6894